MYSSILRKKFRTLSLAITALAMGTVAASAQSSSWGKGYDLNDATVAYGFMSINSMASSLEEITCSSVEGNNMVAENRKSIGAISAEYLHRNKKKVSYGVGAGYEQIVEDCVTRSFSGKTNKVGELTCRYVSVMALLRFNWVEKKHFAFYSKLGLGVSFITDSYSDTSNHGKDLAESTERHFVALQASPLGFRWGQKIGGFFEVGVGTQGVVRAGASYKF